MEIKKRGKKFWIPVVITVIVFLILIGSVGNSTAESKQANEKVTKLETDFEEQSKKLRELEKDLKEQESDLKEKDSYIEEMEIKLEEAKPWFEMSEKEQERKVAEEKKKEDEEKAAAEKKAAEEEKARLAAEEEERKKQEEKEKEGYETGITFDQLARTPEDYEGEKVKFSGKVIQVMEGNDNVVQLRIAVKDNYDKVIYIEYDSDIVESRVLEDDQITVMGTSAGLLTYESTMGGNITIPALLVDKIDQ